MRLFPIEDFSEGVGRVRLGLSVKPSQHRKISLEFLVLLETIKGKNPVKGKPQVNLERI